MFITVLSMSDRMFCTSQYVGHRFIDVRKKLMPTGTQIIEALLATFRSDKAILRAFAMTCESIITRLALIR